MKKAIFLTSTFIVLSVIDNFVSTTSLFGPGKEYSYNYETLVTAGQERPSSFASAYKIKGILKVSAISSANLSVGIDNVSIGVYNGPWTYFPIPNFEYFETPDLSALSERFHIVLENGKFKTLILNDLEPEWASNMKRGLATFLQMDFNTISSFDQMQVVNIREMTTVGECKTKHEVLPGTTTLNKLVRINKFRNHADCPDIPTRAKIATTNYYQCSDKNSRDIMNSTAYATYEMEIQNGQPLVKSLTLFSSILFWPFTSAQSYQFSWLNMTVTFNSATDFGNQQFPPPENAENHEDLMYSFEQPDPTDVEDENPDLNFETNFFHQSGTESDSYTMEKTMELCHSTITKVAESVANSENYLSNTARFHEDSALSFIPIISSLDYDHLTQCYKRYSEAASQSQLKLIEFHLFLDGLILSGTSQSTLVLRDILISNQDVKILARIATSFPYYIRNPTESIATEMDLISELFNNTNVSPTIKRMIELSMASVIGRCCKKTLCTSSGLLDKYINYFENKLTVATNFEDRTSAILGLRNLAYGHALDKVLDIASGILVYEQTVRVQAIWAVSSLGQNPEDSKKLFSILLPVFYNRTEHCEIRTTIFTLLMNSKPDKTILHNIAYFMWTEYCPQTYNIVRSFLTNAVKSKSPCNNIGSYAQTILNYLPPGSVDPLRTTIYSIDYYDPSFGLGHETYSLVQKTGTSSLPVSVYVGINNFMGGFASSSIGIFIRMEGIDKSIAAKISALRQTNIEKVQKILSKINVSQRPSAPMYLEFILICHNHATIYYAANEKTLASSFSNFLDKLGEMKDNVLFSWEQSSLLGGVLYQMPLEIGTPVSISFGALGSGSLSSNISQTQNEALQKSSNRLQFNLFGKSSIANHVPVIGTMHAVTTHRSLRFVLPRNINFQWGDGGLKIINEIPSENNPILAMAHGTSLVSISYDSSSNAKQDQVDQILEKSCPNCQTKAVISLGDTNRKSRNLWSSENLSPITGVRIEGKFFDCERDHSRSAVIKRFHAFSNDDTKNTGLHNFLLSKWWLTSQQMLDYLFWSPSPETCGIKFLISQDSSPKLQTIESSISTEVKMSDSTNGGKTINFSITADSDFNYAASNGTQPSKSTINSIFDFSTYGEGNGAYGGKTSLNVIDKLKQKHSSVCLDYKSQINQLPKDILSYENENEPTVQEDIEFQYGQQDSDSNPNIESLANVCLSNLIKIKINGRASRSFEQIMESNSDISPYKECRAQKASGQYSGPTIYTPPTLHCFLAAIEQTSLRSGNASIYYKISKDIDKRWSSYRLPLASFLYPYYTFSEASIDHHEHSTFTNELSRSSSYNEGFIEVETNVKKDTTSEIVVFYQKVTHNNNNIGELSDEQHWHGLVLAMTPDYLKPKPVPGRFSPYLSFGFQSGFLSQCTVNPSWVSTLDSFTFNANISECPTLMSADCGPDPQYVVLVKKISHQRIGLNVQLGEDDLQLSDVSGTIILNGKSTKIPNREKYSATMFDLLKNDDEIYLISRLAGIHIRYTGYFATITLDSRYRGVHCGLCGHWDSYFPNDLRGPNTNCPSLLSPQSFVTSYIADSNEKNCKRNKKDKCPGA